MTEQLLCNDIGAEPPERYYAEVTDNGTALTFHFQKRNATMALLSCKPRQDDALQCENSPAVHYFSGTHSPYRLAQVTSGDVYALSAVENGVSSGLTSHVIYPCQPDKRPNQLKLTLEVTDDSLRAAWVRPPCDQDLQKAHITRYSLVLQETSTSKEKDRKVLDNGWLTHTTFRGLEPATEYSVSLQAASRAGYGPRTVERKTTADAAPEDGPWSVAVTSVSAHSATLSWRRPRKPNSRIVEYELFVQGGMSPLPVEYVTDDRPRVRRKVSNLEGFTSYDVTIVAFNSRGHTYSKPISFTTLMAHPSAVASFGVFLYNASQAMAYWTPPSPAHAPIHYYTLYVTTSAHSRAARLEVPAAAQSQLLQLPCAGVAMTVTVRMWPVAKNGSNHLKGYSSREVSLEACSVTSPDVTPKHVTFAEQLQADDSDVPPVLPSRLPDPRTRLDPPVWLRHHAMLRRQLQALDTRCHWQRHCPYWHYFEYHQLQSLG